VPQQSSCEQLNELNRNAQRVFREVQNIRRARDLNFFEDADLNGEKYECVTAVIKHLLAGHHGQPCPAGPRPIVSASKTRIHHHHNMLVWR